MLLVSEVLENYLGGATCGVDLVITEDDEIIESKNIKRVRKELSYEEFEEDFKRRKDQLRRYLDYKVCYFDFKILKGERVLEIVIER